MLLEETTKAIVDSDLDLLNNKEDSGHVLELVSEVALAEDVVQVVLEAKVLVLNDEDVLCLLNDGLLEAVVDDLEVLFLELEHLLLVVEGIEAVGEVEAVASTVEAVVAESAIKTNSTELCTLALSSFRTSNRLSGSETSRNSQNGASVEKHLD